MIKKYFSIIKFLISGSLATSVNLGALFLLTEYAGFNYLFSSVISFTLAFFVSFFLQKYWTFRNKGTVNLRWQLIEVLIVSLANLACNTLLIFILVEIFHLWYLLAAFITAAVLAVASFFIYRRFIFVEGKEGDKVRALVLWIQRTWYGIS